MVSVHLEVVLAWFFGVENEELVNPICALSEVVQLERSSERFVRPGGPEVVQLPRRVREGEMNVLVVRRFTISSEMFESQGNNLRDQNPKQK